MSCGGTDEVCGEKLHMRRKCGCVKNIEDIKELLRRFPTVPPCSTADVPPTPNVSPASRDEECELDNSSLMTQKNVPCEVACEKMLTHKIQSLYNPSYEKHGPCPMDVRNPPAKYSRAPKLSREKFSQDLDAVKYGDLDKNQSRRFTNMMLNMIQLIQMLLTCIALLIYYCIFCYMHLVYFTLRSAVYFHQADAAMKTTIVVVTVTSLVIALNVLMKLERLVGMVE